MVPGEGGCGQFTPPADLFYAPVTLPPEPAMSVAPAPTPPAAPATPGRFALPRREFFVGGLAGLVAGKAVSWVQPLEWTQKELPTGTRFSFAQQGEDLVADSLLTALGATTPTYLDIGAYDPILGSNTYHFYRKGGRGVLVEPNVSLTDRLRRVRPKDTVLPIGIGLDDTPAADYFVFVQPQLNTFDKEQADRLVNEGGAKLERVVKMPLVNVNRVIAEHFGAAPDFLSVDVEGLDLAILKTLDFGKYRPKVICAETLFTGSLHHNPGVADFLAGHGYAVRGMTHPNTLFVDTRLIG